ncbi:hypothetical protein C8R42DRAFT_443380 [Lentinula raphanica]|nr:hypothetical protein C8R42DRAFT_443380 [Lentinula raphanica]
MHDYRHDQRLIQITICTRIIHRVRTSSDTRIPPMGITCYLSARCERRLTKRNLSVWIRLKNSLRDDSSLPSELVSQQSTHYKSYLLTISSTVNYNAMTRPVLIFPLSLTFVFLASTVAPASEVLTAPTSFHERRWIDDLDQPDHSRLSRIAVINDHGPHLQGSSTALASAQRRDVSFDILDVRSVDSNRYEELGDEHQSERGSIDHRRDRRQVFDSFVTSRSVENKHAEVSSEQGDAGGNNKNN